MGGLGGRVGVLGVCVAMMACGARTDLRLPDAEPEADAAMDGGPHAALDAGPDAANDASPDALRDAGASPDAPCHERTPPALEKRVFVTEPPGFDGALTLRGGADAICNARARAAGLEGCFVAWIGDGEVGPADRFHRSDRPYRRLDGVKIADDWDDLTDGRLDAPIAVTERGELRDRGNVWTGVDTRGRPQNPGTLRHCMQWTRRTMAYFGGTGNYLYTGRRWTNGAVMSCQQNIFSLYCFEW